MKISSLLMLVLSSALTMSSCTRQEKLPQKIHFMGEAQGTYYSVTYFATDTLITQLQIDSMLTAFDLSASVWVDKSIISRINNNDPDVIPNQDFINIFKQSKIISEKTDGAFDITVGPLVDAWGFGFRNKIEVNQHVVDSLLPLVNFEAVRLTDGKIIKDNPAIQIDYNAIAQGYSVDLLGGFMNKQGIENFLIDIGGEVIARGTKPDGNLWVIGIEKPSDDAGSERELKATLGITNKAVATSGNYRKFYEVDGVRYSHTIDPKTGYPVRHTLLSATVITDSASIADGYATAFMVMGIDKAKAFLIENPELEAYFIYSDVDGSYKTWMSSGLNDLIKEQ